MYNTDTNISNEICFDLFTLKKVDVVNFFTTVVRSPYNALEKYK